MFNLLPIAIKAGQELAGAAIKEFTEQGHDASGQGLKSIRPTVEVQADRLNIIVWGNDYLKFVNAGRKPGTMPNLENIKKWIITRRIDDRIGKPAEVLKWAFALSIKKNGIPSKSSFKYSNNGRRTKFVEKAVEDVGEKVAKDISEAFLQQLQQTMKQAA